MQHKQQKEELSAPAQAPEFIKTRIIAMFSLARKAGKLAAGADMVKDAVIGGRTRAVFTASDLAPRSLKEIRFACRPSEENPKGAQVLPMAIAMDEMASQIGRRSGILAVTDAGFEKKLTALVSQLARQTAEETNTCSGRESC